jgi:hypothetical protein
LINTPLPKYWACTIPKNRKDITMFAIVETGGKQYQVEEGKYLDVELL